MPNHKSTPVIRDRARGALLGLAVGDALGTTLEFSRPKAPPFPELARGPHSDITGGGPFRLVAGQVTDDTQMACCLAASLRERGRFDVQDVAARYVAWSAHAFDIGGLTSTSLKAIRGGAAPERAGRQVWLETGKTQAGNGSLMRTAPIGVAMATDAGTRRLASLADSAITHYDPRCRLACAAFNAAIAAGLMGAASSSEMLAVAAEELQAAGVAAEPSGAPEVAPAVAALEEDLSRARMPDPGLYTDEAHLHASAGFVRVAFRVAFWELLHAPDLRSGLVDVVNRGGDADTNGAIAGALLGALHGEGGIPAAWRDKVLDAVPAKAGPLRDLYHPRSLLELVR